MWHLWDGVTHWEVHDLSDNLLIRVVDGFKFWDPFGLSFVLEDFSLWSNGLTVTVNIAHNLLSEVLVSLSGASPVGASLSCVVKFDTSWGSSGRWSELSLLNLVVPGSSVHTTDSLSSGFPVVGFIGEFGSGVVGVLEVRFKICFDLMSQSESLVNAFINASIDIFSSSILGIREKGCWLWLHSGLEFLEGISESLEFSWPLSISGSLESSFLGSNRSLVVNEIVLEFLSRNDIRSLGIGPHVNAGFLVVLGERPFSGGGVLVEVDLGHLVVKGISVLLVDRFSLTHESLNFLCERLSLCLSVVNEFEDIVNDGIINCVSGFIHSFNVAQDVSSGSKGCWLWLSILYTTIEVTSKFFP